VQPGAVAHVGARRRPAVEHWLLSAHPNPDEARREWQEQGITLFPLGALSSAVRLPGRLVHAVAATADPPEVGAFLDEAFQGGPVICDPHGRRYYALVPGRVPTTWRAAAEDWRAWDVDCLGRGTYLGVPRPDMDNGAGQASASYWSVPTPPTARLCPPLSVARLIAAGVRLMSEDTEPCRSAGRTPGSGTKAPVGGG
jgi:hypothetical protein